MASDIERRRREAARESSATYRDRRQALITAAAETFREQGLEGASLIDIAKRAGIDRASLYYYVKSKEDLYQAVVGESVVQNVTHVEELRDGDGDGAGKLRSAITLLMKSYDENYPHLYLFVAEDFGRTGPARRQGRSAAKSEDTAGWRAELAVLGDRYHAAVRDIIAEGFKDGTLKSSLSAGLVAHGIIGMVSWSHRWYKPNGRDSADDIADGFVAMVLDGLRPPG